MKCMDMAVIIGATGIVTGGLRKNFGRHIRKTFSRFTITDSYTRNITHNTESIAV
jgi:hypothetical protein